MLSGNHMTKLDTLFDTSKQPKYVIQRVSHLIPISVYLSVCVFVQSLNIFGTVREKTLVCTWYDYYFTYSINDITI